MQYRLSPISTRNHLTKLVLANGLSKHAVEIGTHRGEFAKTILDHWPGTLTCIDPWHNLPGYEDQAMYLWGGAKDRQEDYIHCKMLLHHYKSRVHFMRTTSKEGSRQFSDESVDYVYIDGDHKTALTDLETWWPKLRTGGIIAVHDWMCPGEKDGGWARYIQPDVTKFSSSLDVDMWLIPEEMGLPWTIYAYKP